MNSRSARSVRWLLGYALAVAALVFAGRYVGVNATRFTAALGSIEPVVGLMALALFCGHVWLNAVAFSLLSRAFGAELSPRLLRAAWLASLLTKYVPGGVWHVVGRGALLSRHGVAVRSTFWVAVIEQSASLSLCVIWAASAWLLASGAGLIGGLLVLLLSFALGLAARFWAARRGWSGEKGMALSSALHAYALAMAPYALAYVLLVAPELLGQFLYALFAGTVAGVLALPVPGGLGVRESLVLVLNNQGEPEAAMAALIFARLLIFTVEVAFSALGAKRLLRWEAV